MVIAAGAASVNRMDSYRPQESLKENPMVTLSDGTRIPLSANMVLGSILERLFAFNKTEILLELKRLCEDPTYSIDPSAISVLQKNGLIESSLESDRARRWAPTAYVVEVVARAVLVTRAEDLKPEKVVKLVTPLHISYEVTSIFGMPFDRLSQTAIFYFSKRDLSEEEYNALPKEFRTSLNLEKIKALLEAEFAKLPKEVQNSFDHIIWQLNGKPEGDLLFGEHHRYDSKVLFYRAIEVLDSHRFGSM